MTVKNRIPAGEPVGRLFQCPTVPPHRILVVDDEPDIRRFSAEVLIRSGYDVATAKDGLAGWEVLHAARHAPDGFNLLITDHDMPGLTGLALVKRLRAARMALPVIMATGRLPQEDLFARYVWLRPAVALIKPYSAEQLLEMVESVLHATNSREQIASPTNWLSADDLQL